MHWQPCSILFEVLDCVHGRYLLRVTVTRGYGASSVKDFPFWVRNFSTQPEAANLPLIKARAYNT